MFKSFVLNQYMIRFYFYVSAYTRALTTGHHPRHFFIILLLSVLFLNSRRPSITVINRLDG